MAGHWETHHTWDASGKLGPVELSWTIWDIWFLHNLDTHTHRQILCTYIYIYIYNYIYIFIYIYIIIYIYYNLLTINGYFNIYTCNAYAYIPDNCPINCKPNHVLFSRTSLQKLAERHWRTSIIWNLVSRYFDYYFLHIMPSICIYIYIIYIYIYHIYLYVSYIYIYIKAMYG